VALEGDEGAVGSEAGEGEVYSEASSSFRVMRVGGRRSIEGTDADVRADRVREESIRIRIDF